MRKLIEATQEHLVVCDKCGYKVKNETGDPWADIDKYLNKPCPECGENLLTAEDLSSYQRMIGIIKWMNKWFSWLTIFIPKSKERRYTVHAHDGIVDFEEKENK